MCGEILPALPTLPACLQVLPDEADLGEPSGPDFAEVERLLQAAERRWQERQGGGGAAAGAGGAAS